jgi:hypothetical protein
MQTTQDRQEGWFGTHRQPLYYHYTVTAGASALCNKSYHPRMAPLNDGTGLGYELLTDEELATSKERYDFIKSCPRCEAKKKDLGT